MGLCLPLSKQQLDAYKSIAYILIKINFLRFTIRWFMFLKFIFQDGWQSHHSNLSCQFPLLICPLDGTEVMETSHHRFIFLKLMAAQLNHHGNLSHCWFLLLMVSYWWQISEVTEAGHHWVIFLKLILQDGCLGHHGNLRHCWFSFLMVSY